MLANLERIYTWESGPTAVTPPQQMRNPVEETGVRTAGVSCAILPAEERSVKIVYLTL